jgi:hypothetical protein
MQLNFLTGYDNEPAFIDRTEIQSQFWDGEFKLEKLSRQPYYKNVEKFFTSLDYSLVPAYKEYWTSVKPKNDSEIFQRWLLAFMSVHTSWQANIVGYEAIKQWWLWLNDWNGLKDKIEASRVGMQNNRTRYISAFAHKFWADPEEYKKKAGESWSDMRERLKHNTLGLGSAKTSFALEMCYPTEAKLVCLDTHMFQAYKLDQVRDNRLYSTIEQHWTDMCAMWNVPPYIARCLYWDIKQGHSDSRYWSKVLETK